MDLLLTEVVLPLLHVLRKDVADFFFLHLILIGDLLDLRIDVGVRDADLLGFGNFLGR